MKLRLGFYPYTYVRAQVMRSLLIKKEDYHKLLKMSLNGIIKFLQESVYKDEINKLAGDYSGVELIELALNENLVNSFNKLRKISPDVLKEIVDIYSKRWDIENIKLVLRAKYTKADKNTVIKYVQAAGTLEQDFFVELFEMGSIEEILKNIKIVPFNHLKDAFDKFQKENTLISIETALDKYYYEEVLRFAKDLPDDGKMFRETLKTEIEIKNIMTLLQLYREKMDKVQIKEHMVSVGARVQDSGITHLAEAGSLDELFERLEKTRYGSLLKEGIEKLKKENTLIDIEIALYNHLLKKSILMLHQYPIFIDAIPAYMLAKEIEIKNLTLLTKGKELGLEEDFIEKQLVMT